MSDLAAGIRASAGRRALLLLIVLAGIALAYAPGLSGTFLFDDYANLNGLKAIQAEPSLYSLAQYVLGGQSTELGRPLSLLSFAAQTASWDSRPGDFIAANLALHLFNGLLWYLLLSTLQRAGAQPASRKVVLAATAIWLLLPIHAATVLYVVQRMAMLATTCVLAGAVLYVSGRMRAVHEPRAGYARMVLGVGIGTGLGTLCKETAALTPLMLLALEGTLLRTVPKPAGWKAAAAVLLWLPTFTLLAYLGWRTPDFLAAYSDRTFTLGERLLTECRVLFVYLQEAFLPSMGGVRVLYDDLPLSTNGFHPWTTALAVAAWVGLAGAALRFRTRAPALSFAVAWYLAGSLLEASVIPLEIAFSHRSYLPLLGPALAFVVGIEELAASEAARKLRGLIFGAATVYALLLLAGLVRASTLWGEPLAQAKAWLQLQPESQRAVLTYGNLLMRRQDLDSAYRLYRAAWAGRPNDAIYALAVFDLGCLHPGIHPAIADVRRAVLAYRGAEATIASSIVEGVVSRMQDAQCPHQTAQDLLSVIEAMLESPGFPAQRFSLYHSSAMTLDLIGDKRAALARIEQALELDPQVPVLQQAALWSVQLGDTARAHAHLRTAEASPRISARKRWLYRREIAGTRQLIELYESLPGRPPA